MVHIDLGPSASIEQISTPSLGDHSYLVVAGGGAAYVDPQRDIERFVRARPADTEVLGVLETHIHNDYVSGGHLLAAALDAEYLLPADTGATVPHRALGAGASLELGDGWFLQAVATPGHTPHHTAYVLHGPEGPVAALTGGSLMVGSVGRTDLLGADLTVELTRAQHRSVRSLAADLADPVAVAPTHGAGSFCAATPGGAGTHSTVGAERTQNPALLEDDEDAFVAAQLAGFRLRPSYYEQMAPINLAGGPPPPEGAPAESTPQQVDEADLIIDLRHPGDFAAAHVPGSINIPYSATAAAWAGWVAEWGAPVTLVGSPATVGAMRDDLARIGWDAVVGVVTDDLGSWREAGGRPGSYRIAGFDELAAADDPEILDVRDPKEAVATIPGAIVAHPSAIVADTPPVSAPWVHCASGYRASIAASLLAARGVTPTVIAEPFARYQGDLDRP